MSDEYLKVDCTNKWETSLCTSSSLEDSPQQKQNSPQMRGEVTITFLQILKYNYLQIAI
jgi:hypothetical protein